MCVLLVCYWHMPFYPLYSMLLSLLRGSAIAKIIGHNAKGSNRFDPIVNMWVYEEIINGKKLTEIINTEHENVKYLPGHKLPKNVVGNALWYVMIRLIIEFRNDFCGLCNWKIFLR